MTSSHKSVHVERNVIINQKIRKTMIRIVIIPCTPKNQAYMMVDLRDILQQEDVCKIIGCRQHSGHALNEDESLFALYADTWPNKAYPANISAQAYIAQQLSKHRSSTLPKDLMIEFISGRVIIVQGQHISEEVKANCYGTTSTVQSSADLLHLASSAWDLPFSDEDAPQFLQPPPTCFKKTSYGSKKSRLK